VPHRQRCENPSIDTRASGSQMSADTDYGLCWGQVAGAADLVTAFGPFCESTRRQVRPGAAARSPDARLQEAR